MKVLVSGATGLIGTHLVRALCDSGVGVNALVRDTVRAASRLPASVTLFPWDVVAGAPPAAAFDGVDVVVNLAGESIADGRWTVARRKQLRDSRIVGTRALVNEMRGLTTKPRVLIAASAVGYYGDRGDEILTEASSCGTGFLAELARDWEEESNRAAELGMRVVVLRNGAVLSREGGFLRKVLPLFRLGAGGRVGSGTQWFPWIHIEDEIALIRHAITDGEGVGRAQRRRARAGHQSRAHRRARRSAGPPDGAGGAGLRAAAGDGGSGGRGAAGEPAGDARAHAGVRVQVQAAAAAGGAPRPPEDRAADRVNVTQRSRRHDSQGLPSP